MPKKAKPARLRFCRTELPASKKHIVLIEELHEHLCVCTDANDKVCYTYGLVGMCRIVNDTL